MINYKQFLLKEKKDISNKMVYSDIFIDILNIINSDVSNYILSMNNKDNLISYIDITDNNNFISFIQVRNIKSGDDPWKSSSRQEIRVGKFANRLSKGEFSVKEIEDFVNSYKSSYEFEKYIDLFDIVDGDDLLKYYYKENQIRGGQLGKSCMNGIDQQPYIKSFLVPNSDIVKMLILRDKNDPDYIVGRANIWYLNKPKGEIFMDRIYTNEDYLVGIFIEYAKLKGYIYKSRQIYGGHNIPVIRNGKSQKIIMSAKMKIKDYKSYPYIDTLQFYNKETGEITSDMTKWDDTIGGKTWVSLIHAGGAYFTKDNDGGYKMDYLGRIIHPYFVKWSNIDKCYIHVNDAIYLSYKDDYCTPERDIVEINGKNYLKEDTFFDNKNGIYRIKNN